MFQRRVNVMNATVLVEGLLDPRSLFYVAPEVFLCNDHYIK